MGFHLQDNTLVDMRGDNAMLDRQYKSCHTYQMHNVRAFEARQHDGLLEPLVARLLVCGLLDRHNNDRTAL